MVLITSEDTWKKPAATIRFLVTYSSHLRGGPGQTWNEQNGVFWVFPSLKNLGLGHKHNPQRQPWCSPRIPLKHYHGFKQTIFFLKWSGTLGIRAEMTKLIDEPTPATLKTTHILSHIMFNISHISLFIFYSCAIVSKNVGMWIISWTILWTKKKCTSAVLRGQEVLINWWWHHTLGWMHHPHAAGPKTADETGMLQGAWSTFDCWSSSDRKTVSSARCGGFEVLDIYLIPSPKEPLWLIQFRVTIWVQTTNSRVNAKKQITEWPKLDDWKLTGWQHRFNR